jgi:hypothetical protein
MAIVCVECGSEDVQVKRWVNPNTDKPMDDGIFDLHYIDDNWCISCDDHVNLKEEDED